MSEGQPFSENVIAAIQQGRKIEAIKLLREETGLGLKEAKHAVEAHERLQPPLVHPPGPKADSSFGRFVWLAAIVVAAAAAFRFLT